MLTPSSTAMTFVTKLTLQSGDRAVLDEVVGDIRDTAERKGVELKGPHTHPPKELRVPLFETLSADAEYPPWNYTVYRREMEIVGHDDVARQIAGREYPSGVHVAVEVEQVNRLGKGRSS